MQQQEAMDVCILGTGLLGGAIAARVQEHGWRLRLFDPSSSARERLGALPAVWAASEAEALAGASRAILCFPNSGVTAGLVPGLFEAMAPGGIVIDCTTGDPEEMAGFAALAAGAGRGYLDATIGGSSAQARAGQALLMVGGSAADLEAAMPLLRAISEKVVHAGPAGHGARMKLVLNLALGLHRAVLAEALHLGKSLGLDPALVLSVLREGPAYSRIMDRKGERMLHGDFQPEARLSQHRKDVGLMLEAAEKLGISLPLTVTHDMLLAAAEEAGFGKQDNSAIVRAYFR